MATSPPTGGIVTVPDPITGGAGAAVTTTQVINAMWANAQSKSAAGSLWVDQAISIADPAPQLAEVVLDKTYLPPVAPAFPSMDPNNGQAIYDAEVSDIESMIVDGMASYIAQYLTHPEYFDHALAWCDNAIQNGGTGINTVVEADLWQRGRARVLSDSARAEDEAGALWASRGFPIPPGVLVGQVNEIRLDAGRKLAEVSRDVSIKSFDAELENTKFAIKLVVDTHQDVLKNALDYVRTLIQGPQVAMQLATGLVGIQNDYIRSLVGYYDAQVRAYQPRVQLAIADAGIKMEGEKANLQAQTQTTDSKVKAALTGAQMLASMASAGINAINAQTSISGSDSSSL